MGFFLGSSLETKCPSDSPCYYEGPQRRIMRTLFWRVWQVLHVAFLKSDSQSHPSEKTWFPYCSFTSTHCLVSQVPSPVPQPPWPLALQKDQTHLTLKPLSPFSDRVYSCAGKLQKFKLHIVIWTCVKMPFISINPYKDFSLNSLISGLPSRL